MKLQNKVAIITGATRGMGEEIAYTFAREGAKLILSGRNEERGNAVQKKIREQGGNALFVKGDITSYETNQALVQTCLDTYGTVDILVCSAGLLGLGKLTELLQETWEKTIATNLSAVYYLTSQGIPVMKKKGKGSIVIIGSIAGYKTFPAHPAYCASKGALIQLTKQIALDYGPEIRINLLNPGQVDTPLLQESTKAFPNPDTIIEETIQNIPLKRLGLPEDIAKAALFLASDDASWITGSNLVVDGGVLCNS
ncbi:MAG: glucose 1-dehydrogenase [Bacteroidales bacterium]|nr:glucose 1-dehydrogenase [Bacteroidales bacterium]